MALYCKMGRHCRILSREMTLSQSSFNRSCQLLCRKQTIAVWTQKQKSYSEGTAIPQAANEGDSSERGEESTCAMKRELTEFAEDIWDVRQRKGSRMTLSIWAPETETMELPLTEVRKECEQSGFGETNRNSVWECEASKWKW